MSPFRVPTATVRLSTKMDTTKSMPEKKKDIRIITMSLCQALEQGIQRELPRDKVSPGLQLPQSRPERLLAHCASAPLSIFRLR